MLDAFVINLDHRKDRWENMKSNWSHIFRLHRIPGVKSKKKYLGCAQAHVNSIQTAFALNPSQPFCLVLEDDVKPLKTGEYYASFISKLSGHENTFDCISLNSTFERNVSTESFQRHPFLDMMLMDPSLNLMSGTSFMIYSKNILKKIEEYQNHLNTSSFVIPNDRLFCSAKFGFYQYNPLVCFIPSEEVCSLSSLAHASDNFGGDLKKEYGKNLDILLRNSSLKSSYEQRMHPSERLSIKVTRFYSISFFTLLILLAIISIFLFP